MRLNKINRSVSIINNYFGIINVNKCVIEIVTFSETTVFYLMYVFRWINWQPWHSPNLIYCQNITFCFSRANHFKPFSSNSNITRMNTELTGINYLCNINILFIVPQFCVSASQLTRYSPWNWFQVLRDILSSMYVISPWRRTGF